MRESGLVFAGVRDTSSRSEVLVTRKSDRLVIIVDVMVPVVAMAKLVPVVGQIG